jgi:hypothetical protein
MQGKGAARHGARRGRDAGEGEGVAQGGRGHGAGRARAREGKGGAVGKWRRKSIHLVGEEMGEELLLWSGKEEGLFCKITTTSLKSGWRE